MCFRMLYAALPNQRYLYYRRVRVTICFRGGGGLFQYYMLEAKGA